jgi:hypothetical protein
VILRELLNLEIPFATCALFIYSLFFKIVLIVDLAILYSALRSPTLFALSHLEIISFLMSKLISFFTLFCWLMANIL